jgi:hypothetical protein
MPSFLRLRQGFWKEASGYFLFLLVLRFGELLAGGMSGRSGDRSWSVGVTLLYAALGGILIATLSPTVERWTGKKEKRTAQLIGYLKLAFCIASLALVVGYVEVALRDKPLPPLPGLATQAALMFGVLIGAVLGFFAILYALGQAFVFLTKPLIRRRLGKSATARPNEASSNCDLP